MAVGASGPASALSAGDRAIYGKAFAAAEIKRFTKARRIAETANNPLPAKVIRWLALRKANVIPAFDALDDFISNNPDWPALNELRRRAEEAMDARVGDDRLIAWFDRYPPLSGIGRLRLAEAHFRRGDTEVGERLLSEAWIEGNFNRRQERAFLRLHRHLLRPRDHAARLDRLIWDQQRRQAERMLARVTPDYRNLGRARLMLMGRVGGVDNAIARVSAQLLDDPGLVYERARWRRRKGFDARARELLDPLPEALVRPAAWWREVRVQVREALDEGEISVAYRLAAEHRQTDPRYVAQAEWLAGWIALRFLRDPALASRHFATLYDGVRYPISVARAAYWRGRAAAGGGNHTQAVEWYNRASPFVTTYYGQLAAAQVAPRRMMDLPRSPVTTKEDVERIEEMEVTGVVRALADLGKSDLAGLFLAKLHEMAETPGEHFLVAKLAAESKRVDLAVTSARRSSWVGVTLVAYGYPVVDVDGAHGYVDDTALLLAMIRQESGFKQTAVSTSGAQGLLQLMPATAKAMARELKVAYSRQRLLADPEYNIALGSQYLSGLLERYGGSYVLALAAYNAGPTRVHRWIRDHGDPRDTTVDVVDWIELIPFEETRNYVQRIIEAVPIYRRILGSDVAALTVPRLLGLGR